MQTGSCSTLYRAAYLEIQPKLPVRLWVLTPEDPDEQLFHQFLLTGGAVVYAF